MIPGRLFIISSPSGAGKTSLVEAILQRLGSQYGLDQAITYTTKPPRYADPNRQDHHYNIDVQEFERRIAEQFFLEWSNAYGAYYGTPRSVVDLLQTGRSFILVIDRVGAQQVIAQVPNVIMIWITVANMGVLRERLAARGTETLEQIEHRLGRAQVEMDLEAEKPLYHYHILNENFERAVEQLEVIIAQNCPNPGLFNSEQ